MGEVVNFPGMAGPSQKEQLLARLDELRALVAALDEREPQDMDSEQYEQWGDEHEELEDQIDEILELLDEL